MRRQAPRQFNFRLVGGLVADLHGRDLREEPFLRIWDEEDRADLSLALEASRRQAEPIVIECLGESRAGGRVEMEILLAPLTSADGEVDRLLGFYQPLTPAAALSGRPIASLTIGRIRVLGDGGSRAAAAFPHLKLVTLDGRHVG